MLDIDEYQGCSFMLAQPNPAAKKWFSDNLAGGGDLSFEVES